MNTKELKRWRAIENPDSAIREDLVKSDKKLLSKELPLRMVDGFLAAKEGAGPNKINSFVIRSAVSRIIDKLIMSNQLESKNILISNDGRNNSSEFTDAVCSAVLEEGFIPVIFPGNTPTPLPVVSYVMSKTKHALGLMITGGVFSEGYNGILVLDKNGNKTSFFDGELIFDPKNLSTIDKSDSSIELNGDGCNCIDEYYRKLISSVSNNSGSDISIAFTSLQGFSSEVMHRAFEEIGSKFKSVDEHKSANHIFHKEQCINPSNGKSFHLVEKVARKNKSDMMVAISKDSGSVGISVKHQKRYKYLNSDELSALYLFYKLSKLNATNSMPSKPFVVKTATSGTLSNKVAKSFGVKVVTLEKEIFETSDFNMFDEDGFVMALDGKFGIFKDGHEFGVADSFSSAFKYIEMESYFKSIKSSSYLKLRDLFNIFGVHRTSVDVVSASPSKKKKIVKSLMKKNDINGVKVKGREKIGNATKITLENETWVSVSSSNESGNILLKKEVVGKIGEKMIDVVSMDKMIDVIVEDASEEFEDKKFSFKTLIKYLSFISIVIGVFVFVFLKIYKDSAGGSYYSAAKDIGAIELKSIWLSVWIWQGFVLFLDAWMKKRMFMIQGVKVKTRHLIISSLMGWIISFVTPLAVGGDAIGYWYLRRKGVKRGALLATLSTSTMLGEIKYTFQTIFLVAIGWSVYKHVFENGAIESKAALIWFFVGMGWSVFASTMILMLTVSKRVQEFILRNSIKFLEWFRFTPLYDPGHTMAKYQYEFKSMRDGAKRIWTKWYMPIELAIYSLIPLFISPIAMIYASNGLIANNGTSPYWTQIVADDIVGTANSMSFTPGGTGTQEWLNIQIYNTLFDGSNFSSTHNYSPTTIASGKDLFEKIFLTWPFLIFSAILTLTTIFLENIRARSMGKLIYFKAVISLVWVVVILTYLILFIFVLI